MTRFTLISFDKAIPPLDRTRIRVDTMTADGGYELVREGDTVHVSHKATEGIVHHVPWSRVTFAVETRSALAKAK